MDRSICPAACIQAAVLLFACTQAFAINEMFAKDAPIARMTAEDFEVAGAVLRRALDQGRDGETSKTGWNLCRTADGWKVAEGR